MSDVLSCAEQFRVMAFAQLLALSSHRICARKLLRGISFLARFPIFAHRLVLCAGFLKHPARAGRPRFSIWHNAKSRLLGCLNFTDVRSLVCRCVSWPCFCSTAPAAMRSFKAAMSASRGYSIIHSFTAPAAHSWTSRSAIRPRTHDEHPSRPLRRGSGAALAATVSSPSRNCTSHLALPR